MCWPGLSLACQIITGSWSDPGLAFLGSVQIHSDLNFLKADGSGLVASTIFQGVCGFGYDFLDMQRPLT